MGGLRVPNQSEKAKIFKTLHEGEKAFLLPNPWDVGSAQTLTGMGAKALATTSSGFAFTIGKFDGSLKGGVTRDEAVAHAKAIAESTPLPVSGDLENGYGDTPADAAQTVTDAIAAGLAGCSIEDSTNNSDNPSYDFDLALARVKASVEAARAVDFPFQFCARADGVLRNGYDLDEAIRRLQAFEEVGADVLYIPLLGDMDDVKKICASVSKPVNVLAIGGLANHSVDELSAAGARRISIGPGLFNVATHAFYDAANTMLNGGDLTSITAATNAGKIMKARKASLS